MPRRFSAFLLPACVILALGLSACESTTSEPPTRAALESPCRLDSGGTQYDKNLQIGGGGSIFPPDLDVAYLYSVRADTVQRPLRIAGGANDAYVVSAPREGYLALYSNTGRPLGKLRGLDRPLAVAIDSLGRFLVGEETHSAISMLSPTGVPIKAFCAGAGDFSKPNDIAVEPETGIVWIADSANHRVVACSGEGGYLFSIGGTKGVNPGEFNFPTGVAVDIATERVYIADSNNGRVQVFDLTGNYVKTIGSYGSHDGEFLRPQGMVIDSAGRLFVADVQAGVVHAFDDQGDHLHTFGQPGTAPGDFLLPSDLFMDSYGRLHITSYGSQTVEVYGIESYGAPAPQPKLTAKATFDPGILHHALPQSRVGLCLDIPDSESVVAPETIVVAGSIKPNPPSISEVETYCDSTVYEARVELSLGALLATYSDTAVYTVPVAGSMQDGRKFYGTFKASIYASNDAPPTTASGEPIDEPLPQGDGPSGEQPDEEWPWLPSQPEKGDCYGQQASLQSTGGLR